MSRLDYAADIITQLGDAMGLPELALDDAGRASLMLDNVLFTLTVSDDPVELLWLFADLGFIGPDDPRRLETLLRLGFETWVHGQMTIGLDEHGRHAIGHSAIPVADLELPLLKNTLRGFVDTTMAVRERLDDRGTGPEHASGDPPQPPGGVRV